MSEALRSLLAEFVVSVDKAGELAKGNEAVSALKARLVELQAEFAKVKAPAERAGQSVQKAFSGGFAGAPGLAEAMQRQTEDATRNLFGSFGAQSGASGYSSPIGPERQIGPTRDTLEAGRAQMRAAEEAAAKYAQTLRGKLAGAVNAVRAGFNGGGGGQGPGLLASLGTVRNGLIALGVGATARAVEHLVDGIGDIRESAQKLGVTTSVFQRLKVFADQNGTSVEALGTAFRNLANVAVQPTKESTAALGKLGLSAKDANGQFKSTNDLFFEVAGALAGVSNETERSALAQDLLGRSAQELKPIFAGGTVEIEKQRKALAEMNVLSEETINQADDLSDSWKSVGPSFLAATEPLLKLLLPALTDLTQTVFKGIDIFAKWLKNTDLTSVALTALGAVVATKVLPGLELMLSLGGGATKSLLGLAGAGAKAALSFLRMALPLLAIEDVLTFIRGGDSETGRLLDAVFGKGTAEGTLKAITDTAEAFKSLWQWLTGDGKGEKAVSLYTELSNAIKVIANDLLHLMGIGKGGTNGPLSLTETISTANQQISPATAAAANASAAQYGPPVAPVTVGDNIVTITMGPSATAGDVGRSVTGALDRDRNALIASYGGF